MCVCVHAITFMKYALTHIHTMCSERAPGHCNNIAYFARARACTRARAHTIVIDWRENFITKRELQLDPLRLTGWYILHTVIPIRRAAQKSARRARIVST